MQHKFEPLNFFFKNDYYRRLREMKLTHCLTISVEKERKKEVQYNSTMYKIYPYMSIVL